MESDTPFARSEEQRSIVLEARRLSRDVLEPIARAAQPGRVDRPLVRALAEHGLLQRLFPREAGGATEGRASATELCALREGLAHGCTEAETALALQGLGAYPILRHGSDELVAGYVAPAARGEAVAAFALTEREAGSDAGSLRLRAEPEGGGYRLTGEKTWISNAPDADFYTVFARTTPDAGAKGITAFVVQGDSDGLSGEPLELLAPHPIGRIEFHDVHVPADHVLGEVDEGFRIAMSALDLFRPSVGAAAVGMAQAALGAAIAHAGKREAFGRPIREFQAVSHQLAEMATRVEAARLLVYRAASSYDAGERTTKEAAMAKLYATETAQFVIDASIQIHGAVALERGHLLEHLYREVRATRIYEGTSEIQREIIARELFRASDDAGG
ncbi:MAG: acyl-CoA dehydrogenase family protein [Actinomycetota bacterium]